MDMDKSDQRSDQGPGGPEPGSRKKTAFAWALYDWGNSAFATTVMAGFFPLFFKQFWSAGTDPVVSTAQLGLANAGASLLMAFAAPVLGAISDASGSKKKLLFVFTVLGVVMTAALGLVGRGAWGWASGLYVAGIVGFNGAVIFYEALLPSVANDDEVDSVSALGYSLGYLGGGILFALNVVMYLKPALFGLSDGAAAIRWSFVTVAVWWAVFSIPILRRVPQPASATAPSSHRSPVALARHAFAELGETFRRVRSYRMIFLFLVAYWLYMDGVGSVIKLAIDYGLSVGFAAGDLITALLIVQFVGFPMTLVFGRLARALAPKTAVLIGIGVYFLAIAGGVLMSKPWHFYLLAVVIGCVQGGVQSLSRSLFARLVPERHAGEFFGFFNVVGRFATILGPVLVSVVGLGSSNPRLGMAALSLLFVAGGWILLRVRIEVNTPMASSKN